MDAAQLEHIDTCLSALELQIKALREALNRVRGEQALPADRPLVDLAISGRVKRALERNNLYTVNDVTHLTLRQLRTLDGLGPAGQQDVREALRRLGLRLREA